MGLIFPDDLVAWQKWQQRRHVLRRARDLVRRESPTRVVLHRRADEPLVLFALDATTPTALASVLEPLAHLHDAPVGVIAPDDVSERLPGEWTTEVLMDGDELPSALRGVRAVVSAGHFLPVGHAAYRWSQQIDAAYVVVQHGLLTPFVPPLAGGAHLLAFSDADTEFWRSGRADITAQSIGSQLLWNAAHRTPQTGSLSLSKRPVFLGQLHGAELSRRTSVATATAFCRDNDALYRPHPAEVDRLSRWQHARWRSRGIRFADSAPLALSSAPVVSIFSTGVLEAAAAGRDAWVTCVRPPDWVREFWQRYELAEWGQRPTAPPAQPLVEPAAAIADAVLEIAGGRR